MTQASSSVDQLRTAVQGAVHVPGDPGYDDARRVWNAQIDRSPAVVVECEVPADVTAALAHARAEGLGVTVRGGGHNTSGSAVSDGGVMINLGRMNAVEVDVEGRRARVGGGALLSDLDAATQAHGLATTGGMVSHTGVGGLTLGGGMGWLTRKHGLTVDNVVGATVVLADGSVVHAAQDEHPDLFWALRGGGGNFGVVTELELALHPVGPIISFGMLFWELERGAEALALIERLVADLPSELNVVAAGLNAPPAPFVPQEHQFRPGIGLLVAGFGDPQEHAAFVDRARTELPTLFDFETPMPYAVLQTLQDEATAWGQQAYEKGTQLAALTPGAIETLVAAVPDRTSPHSLFLLYRLDGAYCEVAEDATAYGGERTARWATMLVGLAHDPGTWSAERDWVRALWTALQPHSLGIGDYINNMVEFDQDRIVASYGKDKYDRLAEIKRAYDPDNTFRSNANILPATVGA